jgi:hypothetical protein
MSTPNLNLTKALAIDVPDVDTHWNQNWDKIDNGFGILSGSAGSIVPSATGIDDTTAIQNAVTAGAGKRVVFQKGSNTYVVSASITIPSNTEVDLNGNTIQQKANANLQNGLFFVASGSSNVTLKNGTLDVNVANQSYPSNSKDSNGRGFFAYNSTNIKTEGIKVINPYGAQILYAAVNGGRIRLCELHDENGTGTDGIGLNSCSNMKVHNNEGIGKIGVTGYGIHVYGTTVSVSVFDNDMTYYQIVAIGTDYISAGGGATSTMTYVRIDNNNIIEPSADTSIHFGIYGSVCGNTIINSHDVGISIDYSVHTKVNNNVIRTTNAGGIMAPGSTDCTFVGNMISNPGSQWKTPVSNNLRCGIMIQINNGAGGPNVEPWFNTIVGNTIRDDLGTHQMYYGIYIDPNGGNTNVNAVYGNIVSGASFQAFYLPTQTNSATMVK